MGQKQQGNQIIGFRHITIGKCFSPSNSGYHSTNYSIIFREYPIKEQMLLFTFEKRMKTATIRFSAVKMIVLSTSLTTGDIK